MVAYAVVYSIFAQMRYVSYNSYVYDLGVSSQLLYGVLHGGNLSFENLVANKLIYVPIGVLYGIHPYPPALEYAQAAWLAIGSVPLYFIASRRLQSKNYALALALSYLLFYPLAGDYWFDFHFMALFPTFLLISFALRESRRSRLSLVAAALAAMTDFMSPLIIVFYGIYVILDNRKQKTHNADINGIFSIDSGLYLMIIGIAFFGITVAYYGYGYFINYASGAITVPAPFSTGASIMVRSEYFFWLLLPVFFLCLLAPESMIMIIPYVGFALANQYTPYVSTMYYQYPALTAPVIFYSLVLGIERISESDHVKWKLPLKKFGRVTYAVLTFAVILAILFTPLGNLASSSNPTPPLSYDLTGQTASYEAINLLEYHPYDANVSRIISLVPMGSSVLIQNNMPQLTSGYNWTLPDYLNVTNRHLPEYVVADPYNRAYYTTYFSTNYHLNMAYDVNYFLESGIYGIFAEADGVMLLKEGYNGAPVLWTPLDTMPVDLAINPQASGMHTVNYSYIKYNSPLFLPGGETNVTINVSGPGAGEFLLKSINITWRFSYYSADHFINITSENYSFHSGSYIFQTDIPYSAVPIFNVGLRYQSSSAFPVSVEMHLQQLSYNLTWRN
ncbi:MAG: DUF2079 domain-containing protein [Candidatus Thermoplasmatota archaeon]|nr:DUF2079 domain-containing protein [Candidatus Thermoplasmatota archaeon]